MKIWLFSLNFFFFLKEQLLTALQTERSPDTITSIADGLSGVFKECVEAETADATSILKLDMTQTNQVLTIYLSPLRIKPKFNPPQ